MTKRIIDGMSAEQIADYINVVEEVRVDIVNYLESICKPEPKWEDDVAFDSVMCFVGNDIYQLDGQQTMTHIYNIWPDRVYKYGAGDGLNWKLATPISPNDCWKPRKSAEEAPDANDDMLTLSEWKCRAKGLGLLSRTGE